MVAIGLVIVLEQDCFICPSPSRTGTPEDVAEGDAIEVANLLRSLREKAGA